MRSCCTLNWVKRISILCYLFNSYKTSRLWTYEHNLKVRLLCKVIIVMFVGQESLSCSLWKKRNNWNKFIKLKLTPIPQLRRIRSTMGFLTKHKQITQQLILNFSMNNVESNNHSDREKKYFFQEFSLGPQKQKYRGETLTIVGKINGLLWPTILSNLN